MKARITCHNDHPLGKRLAKLFDTADYFSRRNGFDCNGDIQSFLEDTKNYDVTVNFSRAMPFGQVRLLTSLDSYCDEKQLNHKVFNIGSYVNILLLNNPESTYDVEKASLKFAHRKIAFSHMFHDNKLDSYLLGLGHLKEISVDINDKYKHLHLLDLDDVVENIKFMLDRPFIKEMNLQYKQPGNHRTNDGIGLILPGLY